MIFLLYLKINQYIEIYLLKLSTQWLLRIVEISKIQNFYVSKYPIIFVAKVNKVTTK